jgi:hypothetical protein
MKKIFLLLICLISEMAMCQTQSSWYDIKDRPEIETRETFISVSTTASDLGYDVLCIAEGALFNVAAGATFTIDVPISAGDYQIFATGSAISFQDSVPVNAAWFGAKPGEDILDPMQACIKAGAREIIIPYSADGYLLSDTLTLPYLFGGKITTTGFGFTTGKTTIKWVGTSEVMFLVNAAAGLLMENLAFDGNGSAVVLFKAAAETGKGIAFKHSIIRNCGFLNTSSIAIQLGDYSNDGVDVDIAATTFENVLVVGAKQSVFVDSNAVLDITFLNPQFTSILSVYAQAPDNHIKMLRGGSLKIFGGYFGGASENGDTYAIDITDGWLNIYGLESEFGLTGGNNGGLIRLRTPTTSQFLSPTSLSGVRDLSLNGAEGKYVIRIDSASHTLRLSDCSFRGRSAVATYPVIYNPEDAPILADNCIFNGANTGLTSERTISIGNQGWNGYALYALPTVNGGIITVASSPFSLATANSNIHTVLGDATYNAITVLLPSATNRYGEKGRIITLKKIAGALDKSVSFLPNGSETISGLTSINLIAIGDTASIISDGNNWQLLQEYGTYEAVETGNGTGTILMGNTSAGVNAGWLEISPGKFSPYWSDPTP